MYSRAKMGEADDREFQSDPLADLMFTMIAIVLLALIILLPLAGVASLRSTQPLSAQKLQQSKLVVGGQSAVTIAASDQGLSLPGHVDHLIGLDAIGHDPQLRHLLEGARDRGAPLVLLIDPKGSEAAFELEPVMAAHGPKQIYQVRLDSACGAALSAALRQSCGGGADRLEPGP